MAPQWQAVLFIAAIVFFLLDAVGKRPSHTDFIAGWTSLGLACFAVPFAWNAVEAGW